MADKIFGGTTEQKKLCDFCASNLHNVNFSVFFFLSLLLHLLCECTSSVSLVILMQLFICRQATNLCSVAAYIYIYNIRPFIYISYNMKYL